MSTKTIKQRIAVVAVSALTAGILSVVSTPAANAAANVNAGTAQTAASVHGILNIATTASTTGSAVVTYTSAITSYQSVGLINVSDVAGALHPGTTQTAVLLSGGTLVGYTKTNTTSGDGLLFTADGGTLTVGASGGTTAVNGSRTAAAVVNSDTTAREASFGATPNAGATTMTIKMFNKASATNASTYLDSGVNGTLVGQINVTIAATSVAGTLSASNSGVYYVSAYTASSTATSDTAGLGSNSAVTVQFGAARIRDAYKTALATGGLFQVTATNGALVNLGSGAGTLSTVFATNVSDGQGFSVAAPNNNPLSTTVTVSYNGAVIGTKVYSFWGEVAKVTLSDPVIGKQGVTTGNKAKINLFDAANNPIYFNYSGASTFTPASGLISSAASGRVVSLIDTPAINTSNGVVTQGNVEFACGTTTTTSTIQVQYVNNSGTVITSNTLPITCAGTAVSFKASYDKAVYAPGEVATLTVSFFDSKGNPAQAIDNPTAAAITATTSGLESAVVAPGANEVISAGTVKYLYPVKLVEGTFVNTIVASTVNTAATSAQLTPTGAATATLTVKAAVGAVTNAEVLKSIVSLIASINKQIQALQKLILRR
jgi:hypothetical protein